MRPFFPNQILWMVSPDHCDPYRRMTSQDLAEPPPVVEPPPEDNTDHFYFDVVLLVGSESGHNVDESLSQHGIGGDPPNATNAAFGSYSMDPQIAYIDFGNAYDDFTIFLPIRRLNSRLKLGCIWNTILIPTPPKPYAEKVLSAFNGFS